MPIERVPVVHKFGIISHSQRLELQERLLKQSYLANLQSKKPTTKNPFEVTEEFVTQYNNAQGFDEQDRLEDIAQKMLERIKRKAGLKDGGSGNHVDLPVAWTELAQLAQCKGHIQEECLDVMITSLDQALLHKAHIAALFYLAETTLYWLRTEAVHQPYLRTGELKLLRMGQLVFMRLFYHHMSGQLQSHAEFKNRLFTYLDGFAESQAAYNPYPNALLCLRYINEIGKMIIGDCNTEAGELKEGDNVTTEPSLNDNAEMSAVHDSSLVDDRDDLPGEDAQSETSGAISSSVHDLSPTLWHDLDVWRCVKSLSGGQADALRSLGNCGMKLATENWVDVLGAMHILGDAAKASMSALRSMQNLARGIRPKTPVTSPVPDEQETGAPTHGTTGIHGESSEKTTSAATQKLALSDIYEKTEENVSTDGGRLSSDVEHGESPAGQGTSQTGYETSPQVPATSQEGQDTSPGIEESTTTYGYGGTDSSPQAKPPPMDGLNSLDKSGLTVERQKTHPSMASYRTEYSSGPPNTGWRAEVGTDLPSGRASEASSVPTYTNLVPPDTPGLHGWHWEVAITYCDIMADICLHGATSNIQKVALIGQNKDVSQLHRKSLRPEVPISSAGLLDLVYFKAKQEAKDKSPNDWSWRVRYSAIQGLVKLCRCCAGDATKEGLRTVAWNTLLKAHSLEKDLRVLEALKVGQVDANIENLLSKHLAVPPTTIGAKIASGLATLYLPPLPPPIDTAHITARGARTSGKKIVTSHPISKKPLRTSLKQEIQLATALYEPPTSYNTRTSFDLKRMVEDQWRKQVQKEQDEEEDERQKELKKKQTELETKQNEMEEKRKDKLKDKYRGPAYHVPAGPSAGAKTSKLNSNTIVHQGK